MCEPDTRAILSPAYSCGKAAESKCGLAQLVCTSRLEERFTPHPIVTRATLPCMCRQGKTHEGNRSRSCDTASRVLVTLHRPEQPAKPVPQLPQPQNHAGTAKILAGMVVTCYVTRAARACTCVRLCAGAVQSTPPTLKKFPDFGWQIPRGSLPREKIPHQTKKQGVNALCQPQSALWKT